MRTNIAKTPDISINQLEEVFATFNRVSADLGSSYRELEARVSGLSDELAATHSARIKELTEKEQLAAKLSALLDALPGGVIAVDADGIIREENPAAIQILGTSSKGGSWFQALADSASTGPVLEGEVSFQNGKRISISSSAYGEEGDTIILLTDVSENYRLSNLINREKRLSALGEMAARLAHQLRTPLSSAILYLSHLSFPAAEYEKSTEVVKKILNRLRQIENLIDGMLSYIRGDTNANQEFCLNRLLEDVRDATSLQIKSAGGELKLSLPEQQCVITGDREALFNALSNLIENSIQAVKSHPAITLSLGKENNSYKITVEDKGPGIDDSIKDQIFDPFFSTRTTGTGLGLAVVFSAVKAHHGDVSIGTAASGGAIFELMIPHNRTNSTEESGIWGADPRRIISKQSRRVLENELKEFLVTKEGELIHG